MFTIGEFARYGRVSVRMLRHYDAIGLLRPARVDPSSGYRCYQVAQLATLNRIVALKELGFTLEQVRTVLHEQVGIEQLRGMLRLRRAELEATLAADTRRLAQVEARLRTIESEGQMSTIEVIVKPIAGTCVAELSATAASFRPEDIGPVVQPLCAELGQRLEKSSLSPNGRLICYYERPASEDGEVIAHAAIPVTGQPAAEQGLTVTWLPGADTAATVVHRGSMDEVLPAWQHIAAWFEDSGRRSAGTPREIYLECPEDRAKWVTELQEPVASGI